MRPLVRKQFEEWLRGKDANEVVGYTKKEACCPIATFLSGTGQPVGVGRIFVKIGDKSHELPKWATDFIDNVDNSKITSYSPVSASEALAILCP